jgi:uncharacterized protein involved in response to NO
MSQDTIEKPRKPVALPMWRSPHPLWALGFRPFYLLAALLATVYIPLWLAQYLGWISGSPRITLGWHMHEMVFGFAVAVVVGFLFTACRAWTGLWTPRGAHLALLALLWVAGRVAMLSGPAWLAATLDILFLPAAAWSIYRVLKRAGNKRNMFLIVLLGLLTVANAAFHGAAIGVLGIGEVTPVHAAILLIVLIEAAISARVIPMFTDSAAPGPKARVWPHHEQLAMVLMVAAGACWVFGAPAPLAAGMAFLAGCASLLRLACWRPLRTLRLPLLWILHVSYAWIGAGFLLLACAALGLITASTAFHALAVGSMAGLIIGMMTRTSLGHTGRKLVAGKSETCMYMLIQAGALARVAAAIAPVAWRDALLVAAGVCWSASFALFLAVYTPYLWRPRVDGKEG